MAQGSAASPPVMLNDGGELGLGAARKSVVFEVSDASDDRGRTDRCG